VPQSVILRWKLAKISQRNESKYNMKSNYRLQPIRWWWATTVTSCTVVVVVVETTKKWIWKTNIFFYKKALSPFAPILIMYENIMVASWVFNDCKISTTSVKYHMPTSLTVSVTLLLKMTIAKNEIEKKFSPSNS